MEYVNLGVNGLKVSRIALGMMTFGSTEWRPWTLREDAARPIVQRAIELGGWRKQDVANRAGGSSARCFIERGGIVVAGGALSPHPVLGHQ